MVRFVRFVDAMTSLLDACDRIIVTACALTSPQLIASRTLRLTRALLQHMAPTTYIFHHLGLIA
jgi:hypothetical protein